MAMAVYKDVESYIAAAQPFAQPICRKLVSLIRKASPEITTAIKWGQPAFMYKGKILCFVWAFKDHVSFTFYEGALVEDKYGILNAGEGNQKSRSVHLHEHLPVPEKEIQEYLREAMRNIDQGKHVKIDVSKDKTVVLPLYIKKALQQSKLLDAFEKQIYTYRKGYVHWIEQAKQEETKQRRIAQMLREVKSGKEYMGMQRAPSRKK